MADTPATPAPAEQAAETPAETPAEQTPAETPAEPAPNSEAEGLIAEYWRAKLEEAEAEREALREANKKLEHDAAERQKAAVEAARKRVLDEHPEFADKRIADRLRGETEEEILADAKALAEWLTEYTAKAVEEAKRKGESRPTPKLTPGHGGSTREPVDTTAIALAARHR